MTGTPADEDRATDQRAASIEALTARLNAEMDEDEQVALACLDINERVKMRRGFTPPRWLTNPDSSNITDEAGILRVRHTWVREGAHITRQDPARTLREVKAKRDLIAAILAEPHAYIPGDSWYSCSQAVDPGEDDPEYMRPGAGCSDDTRKGKPCDCGRDARVERLLRIMTQAYEGET